MGGKREGLVSAAASADCSQKLPLASRSLPKLLLASSTVCVQECFQLNTCGAKVLLLGLFMEGAFYTWVGPHVGWTSTTAFSPTLGASRARVKSS